MIDHTTAFVHEFALVRRIEREMGGEHQRLQRTPPEDVARLGKYCLFDFTLKRVVETHVDLRQYALDHGLLRDSEQIIPDE